MSTEDNKTLVRRFYGESVHNPAILDELLAPTYVLHLPGSPPISGIEQAKQLMVAYTSATTTSGSRLRTWSLRGPRSRFATPGVARITGPFRVFPQLGNT